MSKKLRQIEKLILAQQVEKASIICYTSQAIKDFNKSHLINWQEERK